MTPVYLAGFGLASRIGADLGEALDQLHSPPAAQWRTVTGLDQRVPYYAIAPTSAENRDWYSRCQTLVRQVVAEAGSSATTGALYLASSSVNVGAIELNQASTARLPAFTAEFSAMLNWQGPVSWINTSCTSGLVALQAAEQAIAAGVVEDALVVGLELENQLCLAGFSSMQLLAPEQARPFAANRNGLVLGEAVAAIRLSKQPCRWRLQGGAQVIDSSQLGGASSGAYQVLLQQTLAQAGLTAEQIDLIKVQAAGSIPNDAVEAAALREFFSPVPALLSLKSLLGHTLGASGVAEIALLLALLEKQQWPDLALGEEALDLALGVNLAAACPARVKYILACNLGFGGSHASLLIEDTDA